MLFIWVFYEPLIFLRPSIFYRLENTQSYAIEFSTLAFPKKVIIEEVFKFVFFFAKTLLKSYYFTSSIKNLGKTTTLDGTLD